MPVSKKLCKRLPEAERRTPIIKFRATAAEKADIEAQAAARNLTVSAYLLRMALHRRADIKMETEMILAVRESVSAIKALHAEYLAQGLVPPEPILALVIDSAVRAILNLERY